MKKILLILVFLMSVHRSQSQNWCPPGATWSYSLINYGFTSQGPTGVVRDKYVGDTVINNIVCKNIVGTFKGKLSTWSPFTPTTTVTNYRRSISYENNKVVYVLAPNTNSFDTVVNFNAAIGDKWLKNRLAGQCNSRRAITVIDTGRVLINNLSLKKIVTSYSNIIYYPGGTYSFTRFDTIIERVMNRFYFMFPVYCERDSISDGAVDYGRFMCYEDNNFALYKNAGFASCDYIPTGLNELSANKLKLNIYPNPASNMLTVESEELKTSDIYTIKVFNILGQSVIKDEIKSVGNRLKIDLGYLDDGIYYVQLSDNSGLLANEKVVKE